MRLCFRHWQCKTNKQTAITKKKKKRKESQARPAFLELTFCFQSGRVGESASHRDLHLPCKANWRAPTLTEPPKFCSSLLRAAGLLASPSVPTWSRLPSPLHWRHIPGPWSSHLKLSSVSLSWAHLLFKFLFDILTINFCSWLLLSVPSSAF